MNNFKEIQDFNIAKQKLVESLSTELDVNKIEIANKENNEIILAIDKNNNFYIEVTNKEIIVAFYNEHHHFYIFDYKSLDDIIESVSSFVISVFLGGIRVEYLLYKGQTVKQKTWIKNIKSNKWKLLITSYQKFNPFLIFMKMQKREEIINFCK